MSHQPMGTVRPEERDEAAATSPRMPWPVVPCSNWPRERITQRHEHYTPPGGEGEPGDCLRAAVASLFGMDLLDVPHFAAIDFGVDEKDVPETSNRRHAWWWAMAGWATLLDPPFDLVPIDFWQWPEVDEDDPLGGCYLLSGKSPRGDWNHSVVAREGQVIWDPHPSRAGLVNRRAAEMFVLRSEDRKPTLHGELTTRDEQPELSTSGREAER